MNFCKNQQFFRLKESTIFFMKIINFIPLISHMCTCAYVCMCKIEKRKKGKERERRNAQKKSQE